MSGRDEEGQVTFSPRQCALLSLLATGVKTIDVAIEHGATARSVNRSVRALYAKTGLKDVPSLLSLWASCGGQPHPDFAGVTARAAERDVLRQEAKREKCRLNCPRPRREPVSMRQEAVLNLVCDGLTNDQIGKALNIDSKTVSNHLTLAYRALEVRNRTEAALKWGRMYGRL